MQPVAGFDTAENGPFKIWQHLATLPNFVNDSVATKAILPDALKADQGGDQDLAEAVAKF